MHRLQDVRCKYFIFILLEKWKSSIGITGPFTSNKNSPCTSIQFISQKDKAIRFNSYSQQIIEWDTFNPLI